MKTIIFATYLEAEFAIKKFGFQKLDCLAFDVYENKSARLCISGIGPANAAVCTAYLLNNFLITEILNIGACGALKQGFALGDIFEISKVLSADPYCDKVFELQKNGLSLISSSKPIVRDEKRAELSLKAELVDMECYGILLALSAFNFDIKKFKAIKLVSDFSKNCDIEMNIKKYISLACEVLENFIDAK